MSRLSLGFALLLAVAGCRGLGSKDEAASDLERSIQRSERQAAELRTLAGLAQIEGALAGYLKDHGGDIPERLGQLVPNYLTDLPTVDVAIKGHWETNAIKYYSRGILRGGHIDGSKLRDTGKWGYVHNDRQVVVFVDCTHPSSRGKSWYEEQGSR